MVNVGELEVLAADEDRAEQRGGADQMRSPRWSPRWIAASASTIVSEDMRSTKALTEVYGMSKISFG